MEEYNFIIRVGEHCTIRAFLQLPEGNTKPSEDLAYDIWKMWGQSAGYGTKKRAQRKALPPPKKEGKELMIERLFSSGKN